MAIPFETLVGRDVRLWHFGPPCGDFFFFGYPAVISEKISDQPAAISVGQVRPSPTLQFHFSRGTFFSGVSDIPPHQLFKRIALALCQKKLFFAAGFFAFTNTALLCLLFPLIYLLLLPAASSLVNGVFLHKACLNQMHLVIC